METPSVVELLESVFDQVHRERMVDMPMVNPALRVQAVGFAPWQGGSIGVLITPWCMNLMHLPPADVAGALQPGGKRQLAFPSGIYEFIGGEASGLGRYEMCSLFSPMFDFPDQAVAVATAQEAMSGLMAADAPDDPPEPEGGEAMSRRQWLRGAFGRRREVE